MRARRPTRLSSRDTSNGASSARSHAPNARSWTFSRRVEFEAQCVGLVGGSEFDTTVVCEADVAVSEERVVVGKPLILRESMLLHSSECGKVGPGARVRIVETVPTEEGLRASVLVMDKGGEAVRFSGWLTAVKGGKERLAKADFYTFDVIVKANAGKIDDLADHREPVRMNAG